MITKAQAYLLAASEVQGTINALKAAGEHDWAQSLTDELNEGTDPGSPAFLLAALGVLNDVLNERLGNPTGLDK
ncbi:MAG: hypothetical protein ACR2P2_15445 [Nakamurella sp.]